MNIISSRLSRLAVAAAAVMALPLWVGCSDLDDDDHYSNSKTEIRNPELKIVAQTGHHASGFVHLRGHIKDR